MTLVDGKWRAVPTDPTAALRTAAETLCKFAGRFSAGDIDVQRDDLQVAIDDVRSALASQAHDPDYAAMDEKARADILAVVGVEPPIIDVMRRIQGTSQADDPSGRKARNRARSMGEDASGGYREIAGCGCDECERHRQADDPSGPCWFCKGTFPVTALIAGYDTFDEQRLACLACNERMQGNWRPS